MRSIDRLAVVVITVHRHQHLRLGLAETVPPRPARRSQAMPSQNTAPIAVVASIAIMVSGMFGMNAATRSPSHANLLERRSEMRNQDGKVGMGEAILDLCLAPEDDRIRLVAGAQQLWAKFSPPETSARPASDRHSPAPWSGFPDHAAKGPDALPETLG